MKKFIFTLTIMMSAISQAGPSVGGGVSEAPWVSSHQIMASVMNILSTSVLISLEVAQSQQMAKAKINCGGGVAAEILFNVRLSCRSHTIPTVCIPQRTVIPVTNILEACRR